MTQLTILLLSLTAAPPSAGQVVSGPGLRPGQALAAGKVIQAPAGSVPVAILTSGGCLLRLQPGARVTLGPAAPGTRCASVRVLGGRVRLLAPAKKGAGPALAVTLGSHRLTLSGEAYARVGSVTGLCVNRGRAQPPGSASPSPRPDPRPAPRPASRPRPSSAPKKGATPTPVATPATRPGPSPASAGKGQCLWLSATGTTRSAYSEAADLRDRKATADTYGFRAPRAKVRVNLKAELAKLTVSLHSGAGGGSDVEGGGQSMCLETGSEGSAADLGSSSVEVTKPPPPTQLQLRLILRRAP